MCETGPCGYGNGEQQRRTTSTLSALRSACAATRQCSAQQRMQLALVWAALYAAIVTIEDTTTPAISTPTGSLWSDAWQRGMASLTVTGTDDAIGVKEARLAVDGQQRTSVTNGACDYTYVDPCKRPNAAFESSPTLDTTQIGDGSHELKVSVVDAANNEAVATRTVRVDNTAPGAPQVTLSGPVWRSANDFDVSWSNGDGQASPIVRARYRLCPVTGFGECVVGDRQGDVAALSDLAIPGDGAWDLRVARDDEAGNEGSFPASASAVLRLDRGAPAAPEGLAATTKRQTGNGFAVRWTNPGGQFAPIVAAHHRVCPAGAASGCSGWVRAAGVNVQGIDGIAVPRAGTWRIEVRLEDEAGNADQSAVAATDVELTSGPTPTPTPDGRKADPRLSVDCQAVERSAASPDLRSDRFAGVRAREAADQGRGEALQPHRAAEAGQVCANGAAAESDARDEGSRECELRRRRATAGRVEARHRSAAPALNRPRRDSADSGRRGSTS